MAQEGTDLGPEEVEAPLEETAKEELNLEDLRKQLEDVQKLAEDRLDLLLRCRADLDNVLKVTAREKEECARYASKDLICKLLPVLDSLEQAAKHSEGDCVLHHQLLDILRSEGLEPIDAVGKKFDPYRHEALFQIKSDEMEEDTVAEEIQKGYLLNSKVIRFSKVAVTKR
jgi:molecular chaperone GrpE